MSLTAHLTRQDGTVHAEASAGVTGTVVDVLQEGETYGMGGGNGRGGGGSVRSVCRFLIHHDVT